MSRTFCTFFFVVSVLGASPAQAQSAKTSTQTSESARGKERALVHPNLGGYYRLRTSWIQGLPTAQSNFLAIDQRDLSSHADFAFMRLRLNPSFSFGLDAQKPIAKLNLQIDGFDNVVLGDNNLLADTPVFGDLPSNTDLQGQNIDSIVLRRAWLEFMIPVGQIRVGRMASHWGLGILANNGNGLEGDFGDARLGNTNDRLLFATRPLTIFNAIVSGDKSETPLILIAAFDKIVEDPHLLQTDFRYDEKESPRSELPFSNFVRHYDDVQQAVFALVWNDKKPFNRNLGEEITAGVYVTHRWQDSSQSAVSVYDLFWRMKYAALGETGPRFFTEGEIFNIKGTTRAISIGTLTEPDILNAVFRFGAEEAKWDAVLEGGYARGDAIIADGDFKSKAINPDHRVGLILFPIALQARTANRFPDKPALWSKGGVHNARYFYPHFRYRPTDNIELVGAFLIAWADELTPAVGGSQRDDGSVECGLIQSDCALGWEVDGAIKIQWGENKLMRWSNEFGLMSPGQALKTVLQDKKIWTVQSRIAVAW